METPTRDRPPLWSALRFEELKAASAREELSALGFWRALGWHPTSALERLKNPHPKTAEEEGRLASLIMRLSELWARWTDTERAVFWARYVDTSSQPPTPRPQSARHLSEYTDTPARLRLPFTLHLYQRRAVSFALNAPRALIALEMGLGKTAIAATLYHALEERGEVRGAIIAAPKSAHGSWKDHLSHSAGAWRALTGRTPQEREAAYTELYHQRLEGVIITHQALSLDYGYLKRLMDTRPLLFVLDEAHKAKGRDTSTGRAFEHLSAAAARVIGLTGTPSPNRAEGFYFVMDRIAPDILGGLNDFAARYTYQIPEAWSSTEGHTYSAGALRADRLGELYERLEPHLFVRTATDPDARLELPPRVDLAPRVELDETQRAVSQALARQQRARALTPSRYEAALRGELGQLEQIGAEGATATAQAMGQRLEQIAITPAIFSESFKAARPSYESPKTALIAEQTLEHLHKDSTAAGVIFCEYLEGLMAMREALIRRGLEPHLIELYTGQTTNAERARISEAVNKGPARVLLGQTRALETGANLQERADFVAHLSTPWAPDTLTQSTARVYRQGQRRRVIILRPSGSALEESKNRALTRKIMTAAQITGALTTADAHVLDTAADPRTRRAHQALLNGAYTYDIIKKLTGLNVEGLE